MNNIDINSAVAVRRALKERGVDTSTPGLKGDARHLELRKRFEAEFAPLPTTEDEEPNTSRSNISIRSSVSGSSTSRSALGVTAATIAALKSALESRNVDTRTPGIRGEERKELLAQRLADYSNQNNTSSIDEESSTVMIGEGSSTSRSARSDRSDHSARSSQSSKRETRPSYSQSGISNGQRPVDRSGSYTSRVNTATATSSMTTITNIDSSSKKTAATKSSKVRPSSSPGPRRIPNASSNCVPWAIRTRVGRGRGRSRGACHAGSTRGIGKKRGGSRRTTNQSERHPLIEIISETPREHEATPRGTRGQPPVSGKL